MAATGDVDSLYELLVHSDSSDVDITEVGQLLGRAISVRVAADADGFADSMFGRILAFSSYQLLRSHALAARIGRRHDRDMQHCGYHQRCDELSSLMGDILALERHLGEIAQLHATTRRVRELTVRTQLENQRQRRADHRAQRRKKSPTSGAHIPQNRIAELLGSDL